MRVLHRLYRGASLLKRSSLNASGITARHCSSAEAIVTVGDAVTHWSNIFIREQIPEPELSAQHIVASVVRLSWNSLERQSQNVLTQVQLSDLERKCLCRLQRMPIQYIIGEWDFAGITVNLRPPVFIPRPETEELVALASEHISQLNLTTVTSPKENGGQQQSSTCSLLEVCCGSGAVSIALLKQHKHLHCTAVDRNSTACQLTLDNARQHGVSDRLRVFCGRLTGDGLPVLPPGDRFNLVLANPPYVSHQQMAQLPSEIKLYEDVAALDGGTDGLAVVRLLLKHSPGWMQYGGKLLIEVDENHPPLIRQLLESEQNGRLQTSSTAENGRLQTSSTAENGRPQTSSTEENGRLKLTDVHKDFSGKDRFVELVFC